MINCLKIFYECLAFGGVVLVRINILEKIKESQKRSEQEIKLA
jgi:hypothetical protein